MIIKRKKINYEKGRKIFFECGGSSITITREFGPEYTNCNIPKEIEELWREEIRKNNK